MIIHTTVAFIYVGLSLCVKLVAFSTPLYYRRTLVAGKFSTILNTRMNSAAQFIAKPSSLAESNANR